MLFGQIKKREGTNINENYIENNQKFHEKFSFSFTFLCKLSFFFLGLK